MNKPTRDGADPALKQQLTYLVSRLNAKLTAQASRLLKEHSGFSLSQWRLMAYLDSVGQARLADFIRFANFDKGQMSRVAQDLVKRGLLKVEVSAADQRMQMLSFTDEGRQEYERVAPFMSARRLALYDEFSLEEHEQFTAFIERLEAASERLDKDE